MKALTVTQRLLGRNGLKQVARNRLGMIRLASSDDKSLCTPTPPPAADSCCPQPPPCPEKPDLPSRLCPQQADPGNPCNYCPPCPESDEVDLSRIKRKQCIYQEPNDIPIHLKGGTKCAIYYQTSLLLTIASCMISVYCCVKMLSK
ncbi:hypothetical protein RUM43_007844 [Polyplax serrata]|uniref:Uncharacterized protein n=1 Tax=Polyplax serrata TaxID=468196 RepID=A0AAN8SA93_POLSC